MDKQMNGWIGKGIRDGITGMWISGYMEERLVNVMVTD